MGIPVPMAPVDPATVQAPVRNMEFAKKLMEIRNGAKKEELSTFIAKEKAQNGFVPLEMPAKKNVPGKTQQNIIPEIAKPSVSGPSFDAYEKALYGDNTPSSPSFEKASTPARGYSSDVDSENNDTDFLTGIRNRLAEKNAKIKNNGQVILNENQNKSQGQAIPVGYQLINERELRETITEVSSSLIKKFMREFLTSEPGLIKESEKIKKAEMIREDIAKIDGKFFKLTPVTVKKK
jgi:hypothetical protein